jgi:hypothetical protein
MTTSVDSVPDRILPSNHSLPATSLGGLDPAMYRAATSYIVRKGTQVIGTITARGIVCVLERILWRESCLSYGIESVLQPSLWSAPSRARIRFPNLHYLCPSIPRSPALLFLVQRYRPPILLLNLMGDL